MSCFALWFCKQNIDSFYFTTHKSLLCKDYEELTDVDKQFAWFFTLPFVNNSFDDFLLKGGEI